MLVYLELLISLILINDLSFQPMLLGGFANESQERSLIKHVLSEFRYI
jgi:hypothetical protein